MKRSARLVVPIVVLALLGFVRGASAQDQQDEEYANEFERMLGEVELQMRSIEGLLARASLEPEQTLEVLEQLRLAVEAGRTAELSEDLRNLLLNNPSLLEKLSGRTEEALTELLSQDDGLETLLKETPDLLKRLLESEEDLAESLAQSIEAENDLQSLFQRTEEQMKQTEEALEKLVHMASETWPAGGSQAGGQPQQPGDSQQQQESTDRQQGNPNGGQNATRPYMPNSRTEASSGDPNRVDPNAWTEPTQDTEGEATEQGSREDAPEGFESEIDAYKRLLAQRQRQAAETEAEENE